MNKKRGMAIVIVLVITTVLLSLAGAYITMLKDSTPIDNKQLSRVQADFWGQGIIQIALLKFKQLPSEFYHAYNYSVRDKRSASPNPWSAFLAMPLQGNINAPLKLSYTTNFKILGQTEYKTDAIEIEVNLTGNNLTRSSKRTITSARIKN